MLGLGLASLACKTQNGYRKDIVGYPQLHYSAMLRFVLWTIWLGKSRRHEWGCFIGSSRKPQWITSQWKYVSYLRFGLPFKTCALVSILSKKIPVWHHWDWRVFDCNMRFHWKKTGLPCLMHIHENEILPVKLPTVCMECNEKKYCGCWRCEKDYMHS